MSAVQRQDVISDEALAAPFLLADNFEKSLAKTNNVIAALKQNLSSMSSNASPSKITKEIEQLTEQEKQLIAVQNELSKALAKLDDEYIDYKKGVNEVNKAVKTKIELGNKDAKTVNAQNSSQTELKAALEANRQAYAKLTNEEARNTKAGKELLAVIQRQDKEYKELTGSQGQFQANVGKYPALIQKVVPGLYSMAEGIWATTKAGLAFIATPLGAVLATIGALVYALTAYFKGSEEGQNRWNKVVAIGTQLWETFSDVLETIGKYLVDNFIKAVDLAVLSADLMVQFLTGKSKVVSGFIDELAKNADRISDIENQMARNERNLLEKREATDLRVAQLRRQADETLDPVRRRNLLVRAIELEEELLKKELANQKLAVERAKLVVRTRGDDSENLKALAEANAKYTELQTQLLNDTRKNNKERVKLEQEIADELAKKRAEERAKQHAERDGDRTIATKTFLDQKKMEVKIAQTSDQAIANSNKAMNAELKRTNEEQFQHNIKWLQNIAGYYYQFSNSITAIFNNFTARRMMALDMEQMRLEENRDKDLKGAGDNEEAKAAIERRFAAEQSRLEAEKLKQRQKEARFEKANALIQAGIQTSLNVLKAFPNPIQIAAAIALGALQIAAIASKPIPQFEKGTMNSPAGAAIVGEKGAELMVSKSGKMELSPGVPTLVNLERGTKIFPHEQTMAMLAASGLREVGGKKAGTYNFGRIERKLGQMERTIKNKKEVHINIGRNVEKLIKDGDNLTRILDQLYA